VEVGHHWWVAARSPDAEAILVSVVGDTRRAGSFLPGLDKVRFRVYHGVAADNRHSLNLEGSPPHLEACLDEKEDVRRLS